MIKCKIEKIFAADILFAFSFFFRMLGVKLFFTFMLFGMVAVLEGIGFLAFIPLITGELPWFLDFGFFRSYTTQSENAVVFLAFTFLIKGLVTFVALYWLAQYKKYALFHIKSKLFHRIMHYDFIKYSEKDDGYFINLINDQALRALGVFHHLNMAIIHLIQGSVLLSIGFVTTWQYALYLLVFTAAVLFIFNFLNTYVSKMSNLYSIQSGKLSQKCLEYFSNWKFFVATGKAKSACKEINDKISLVVGSFFNMTVAGHFTTSVREPLAIMFVASLLLFEIKYGEGSIATILVSLIFFYRAMNNFLSYQQSKQGVHDGIGAIRLLQEELKEARAPSTSGLIVPSTQISSIDFDNVNFEYQEGLPILSSATFRVEGGKFNVITGPSGTGKSTVAALVCRMLQPNSGTIFVNGADLMMYDVEAWRRRIGYLTKDPAIIDGSILENVAMTAHGSYDISIPRAEHALSTAMLGEFVMRLPDTFNTRVGANGFNLSGGQKQRLALAREIYKGAELIILDEPSSALDAAAEEALVKTLVKACGPRCTIICITHSDKILSYADNIIKIN